MSPQGGIFENACSQLKLSRVVIKHVVQFLQFVSELATFAEGPKVKKKRKGIMSTKRGLR